MRDTAGSAAAPAARRRNCLRGSFTVMLHELEHLPGHNHIQRRSGCLLLTQSDRKCASTGFEGTRRFWVPPSSRDHHSHRSDIMFSSHMFTDDVDIVEASIPDG